MDAEGLSLLMGVPVEKIRTAMQAGPTPFFAVPPQWERQGRRRAKEAAAAGSRNIFEVMRFYARRERGARVEIVYE